MIRDSLVFCACLFVSLAPGEQLFEAFLEKHCVSCHGPEKDKGDLRIDELSRDFALGIGGHLWSEIFERINSGEMPPEEEHARARSPAVQ